MAEKLKPKADWLLRAIIGIPIIAVVVMSLVFGLYIYQFNFGLSKAQDVWGQFGDFIGGILNPLIAFLALVSIMISLWVQRRELKETSSALKKQNFDQTFFLLLDLLKGIDKAGTFTDKIKTKIRNNNADYSELLNTSGGGVFFRTLEKILQFVDDHSEDFPHHSFYYQIVQSQLTNENLCAVALRALKHDGGELKILVERAHLLSTVGKEGIRTFFLRHGDTVVNSFSFSAFEKSGEE